MGTFYERGRHDSAMGQGTTEDFSYLISGVYSILDYYDQNLHSLYREESLDLLPLIRFIHQPVVLPLPQLKYNEIESTYIISTNTP